MATSSTAMQVGPLSVQASCNFQSRVQPQATTLLVPCAVGLTNTSGHTLFLTVQSQSANGNGPLPQLRETSTVTFYPHQIMTLPAPPTGQRWQIVAVTRKEIRHVLNDMGELSLLILGLAAYGGYEVVKHRKTIVHHIRNVF